VLVVPLAPQRSGNGLAMRAGMLLEALAGRWPVELVIVPVSGPPSTGTWAGGLARAVTVIAPVEAATARSHLTRQLADATLRTRLAASAPLSARVSAAAPTLAHEALAALRARGQRPRAVFVLRSYLVPFGATLARLLGTRRIIVDLDDDDEAYARSIGADEEADAVARLARAWLPDADVVCAAAEGEARAIAARYGLQAVVTIPNAVRLPLTAPPPPPGEGRLLFVGNLTYGPNVEAARLLVEQVLPIVRRHHPQASLDLVGRHERRLADLCAPGVRVHGMVEELEPCYSATDIVVAPVLHGGGTRIKVLEAFAHNRPLVATPLAVAGLAVRDGREVMLGESPQQLAHAVAALLADPGLGARLAEHAARALRARYVQTVVAPAVCELVGAEPVERPAAASLEPT
jgi:glycosyltransferase involved in cell wall biosynthesis